MRNRIPVTSTLGRCAPRAYIAPERYLLPETDSLVSGGKGWCRLGAYPAGAAWVADAPY